MLDVLLEAAVRSLILAGCVWMVLAGLRVTNPTARLAVWTGVLLGALAMPLLVPASQAFVTLPILLPWLAPAEFLDVIPLDSIGEISAAAAPAAPAWPVLAALAYVVIAVFLLGRVVAGLAKGRALVSRATPLARASDAAVYVSHELAAPMVFGSTILLPAESADWSASKRVAVLAHERSHLARGDFYIQLLAHVHRAFFWFSPLAWWLPRQLAALGEIASDDAAATVMGNRVSYAEILVEVAQDAQYGTPGVPMARGPAVSERIKRLLAGVHLSRPLTRRQRVSIALALAPAILLAASMVGQAPEQSDDISSTTALHDESPIPTLRADSVAVAARPMQGDGARGEFPISPVEISLPQASAAASQTRAAGKANVRDESVPPARGTVPFVPAALTDTLVPTFSVTAQATAAAAMYRPNVLPPHTNPNRPPSAPDFPASLLRRKDSTGSVLLLLTVEANGSVSRAIVSESSGYRDLDESARKEAVKRWRLLPGTVDGQPRTMEHPFRVTFGTSEKALGIPERPSSFYEDDNKGVLMRLRHWVGGALRLSLQDFAQDAEKAMDTVLARLGNPDQLLTQSEFFRVARDFFTRPIGGPRKQIIVRWLEAPAQAKPNARTASTNAPRAAFASLVDLIAPAVETPEIEIAQAVEIAASEHVTRPRNDPRRPLTIDYAVDSTTPGLSACSSLVLRLTVEPDGSVSTAAIEESSDSAKQDESIRKEALRNWRFLPGTVDGEPRAMDQSFKVTFRINDRGSSGCRNTILAQR